MKVLLRTCIAAGAVLFAVAGHAASLDSRLANKLDAPNAPNQTYDVLVFLENTAKNIEASNTFSTKQQRTRHVYTTLSDAATKSQENFLSSLGEAQKQLDIAGRYYLGNSVALRNLEHHKLINIINNPHVRSVMDNSSYKALAEVMVDIASQWQPIGPQQSVLDNISHTGANQVWNQYGVRGEGITVAGQDTGIQWDHPALLQQYRGYDGATGNSNHNYHWHDAISGNGNNPCGYSSSEPCDDNGHGTHTIGTAVGSDGNTRQIGMAPGANWMGCRNMDRGDGRPSTYLECFQFFLAPWPYGGDPMTDGDPNQAADIINNSWSCPASEGCNGPEFLTIMDTLQQAGIFVVVSAGNSGPACSTINNPPAHHSEVSFSVGANNHRNGLIARFSSRGPSPYDGGIGPDLVAPGRGIDSALPGGRYSGPFWNGTSMSGPHVAGAVALLWSHFSDLRGDVAATADLLTSTARPQTTTQLCEGTAGDQIPNNTYGYGELDILAAFMAHGGSPLNH